jgi:exodeoxyribonuclease-3
LLKICSWNVNGIRACGQKGFLEWVKAENPDIFCIQETKAHKEQVPPEIVEIEGYSSWFASAQKKGYSGTAIYSRIEPESITPGLGIEEFDLEGRTVIGDFGDFVLLGCYFPNSQEKGARLDYKLRYDEAILNKCEEFRAQGKEVIICGDMNAAHTEIDLKNPKTNTKNPGFLPEERAWVTSMLEKGYVDIFRDRHPDEEDLYTWWSYRFKARDKNIGWRIDYFLITPGLVDKVENVSNLTSVMGSDHCPISLELKIQRPSV